MAYGFLAGLEPLQGLYTSLFLPFIYTFFGTSKHVAVGTFAISSLMTSSVLEKTVFDEGTNGNLTKDAVACFWCPPKLSSTSENEIKLRIEIAVVLTFLVGICQIFLGALRLGFLTVLLSDELIQGLTTGAACHIFSSQIKHIFGVSIGKNHGLLSLIKLYGCLIKHIHETNFAALVTFLICVILLYVTKTYIDPITRPRIRFPIPMELILVIVTTLISWQFNLQSKFGLSVVDHIPTGKIESPEVPNLATWFPQLLPDAFSIAVVAYCIEVSVAKYFAKMYNYEIEPNQEWFGLGFSHLFGSFFHCHPGGASMSRSLVQGSQGGKSQIVGLINCFLILVVLFLLADMFKNLPKCVLSAIIAVALKSMFKQISNLPSLFRKSKIDFLIWIVTFLSVALSELYLGLSIGVAFALVTVILRSLWPNSFSLQSLPATHKLHEPETFRGLLGFDNIKIFRFGSPLYYGNAETFKNTIYQYLEITPIEAKRKKIKKEKKLQKNVYSVVSLFRSMEKKESSFSTTEISTPGIHSGEGNNGFYPSGSNKISDCSSYINSTQTTEDKTVRHLVIECSMVAYVDVMGVNAMIQIYHEFRDIDH